MRTQHSRCAACGRWLADRCTQVAVKEARSRQAASPSTHAMDIGSPALDSSPITLTAPASATMYAPPSDMSLQDVSRHRDFPSVQGCISCICISHGTSVSSVRLRCTRTPSIFRRPHLTIAWTSIDSTVCLACFVDHPGRQWEQGRALWTSRSGPDGDDHVTDDGSASGHWHILQSLLSVGVEAPAHAPVAAALSEEPKDAMAQVRQHAAVSIQSVTMHS